MPLTRVLGLCAAVGLAAFLAGFHAAGRPAAESPIPPRPVQKEDPPHRSLDANLWMQVSAEYRACCHQAFHLARRRLVERLNDPPPGGWARPPAVVLDLDETVLDNGAFQTRLIRNGLAYDQATWDDYEQTGFPLVRLVPGARAFLAEVRRLGVAPVYVTNRKQKKEFRDGTRNALELLEVDVPGDDLLGAEDTSDKTKRRAAVERYTVLLSVGDNLRDFHEGDFRSAVDNTRPGQGSDDPNVLRAAVERRAYAVDRCADLFGREWVILPNPAYGEWMKVLGLGDRDRLIGQPPPRGD